VTISFDRLLGIKIFNWNKKYLTASRATLLAFVLALLFALFNIYFSINIGYIEVNFNNNTLNNSTKLVEEVKCHASSNGWFIINFWSWVI
jgi:hypothetical protein